MIILSIHNSTHSTPSLANCKKRKEKNMFIIPRAMRVAGMSRPLLIEEKRRKVKKGWVAVKVGALEQYGNVEDEGRKFMIPISYLYHTQFRKLLEKVEEIYGFCSEGTLRLPISVEDFIHLRWIVEKEIRHGRARRRSSGVHSLRSCWQI